jgi:hypothetical protein
MASQDPGTHAASTHGSHDPRAFEEENTPEQNELIARLRATLPDAIAAHPQPEGSPTGRV